MLHDVKAVLDSPRGQLLESCFEHLATGVVICDGAGMITALNPAAETLLALSERQVRGVAVERFLKRSPRALDLCRAARESQAAVSARGLALVVSEERTLEVDLTVSPVFEDDGLLLEVSDVGQHLRAVREAELIAQSESTRVVLRGLAHEIRNPLGGLRGAAQLLEREFPDPAISEYAGVIVAEADRLQNLLERMLGPSQAPRLGPVNLHEAIEHVCSLTAAEAGGGVRIVRDYDPSIPDLEADRDMLVQALLNLSLNAVQALRAEGTLTFRTRVRSNVHVGPIRHRLVAQVDLIDDGPGVPPDLERKLFYPMVTGRAEGAGLGLTIAQSLISYHGGLIECRSQPGRTCFSILVPVVSDGSGS